MRARQQEEKRAAAQATVDANLIPLGSRKGAEEAAGPPTPAQDSIPEVEWWDVRILVHPESYAVPMESERYPENFKTVTPCAAALPSQQKLMLIALVA